ncbi:hypothetical protein CL617_01895 [archaeon]|nr:hypothetical protein [archaeon]|tara:strand:- start:5581 stop:6570 length:990 start_codon:yes stop_codon:yes gene_type:complete
MKSIPYEQYSKYLSIAILVVIIILSYLIIKPFFIPILGSILLAFIFNPLYKLFNKRINNPTISASLVIAILIILVLVSASFIVNALVNEAIDLNNYISSSDTYSKISGLEYLPTLISKATDYIVSNASQVILSIPSKVLDIFIMLFTLFYFLIQGESILNHIKNRLPLKDNQKDHLMKRFSQTIHGLIYGLLITGIMQGILIALAFYLFGVKSPILFGIIVFIFAILPAVGASVIWIPAGVVKILTGSLFDGLGILVIGALLITPIDLILKPKLIGKKSSLHPLAILFGVIGGIKLLGVIGIIYGPLILLLAINVIKFIEETKGIKVTV